MAWIRAHLILHDSASIDQLCQQLKKRGAVGFEIRDKTTYSEANAKFGDNQIIGYFNTDKNTTLEELRARLIELPPQRREEIKSLNLYPHETKDWSAEWKKYFETTSISPRLVVHPPWESPSQEPDKKYLVIDPGMAFGTGNHETTQMCAEFLDEILLKQHKPDILDVGCGSGILSMACAKLESGDIVGIDIDPKAIEIARANAKQNNVTRDLNFTCTPLDKVNVSADIVVANILPHVLIDLSESLRSKLEDDNSLLILSGIDSAREDSVREKFTDVDLETLERRQRNNWVALKLGVPP